MQMGTQCVCGQNQFVNGLGNCENNPLPCGNGIRESMLLEECDDGNTMNSDGCSSNCFIEDGF